MHAAVRTRVRREPQIGGWVRASVLLGAGVGRGGVGGGARSVPRDRAHGKSAAKRDAPVSGSSLYDFRLRASSARREPQPPQAATHSMCTSALPCHNLCACCAHRRRI